MAAAAIVLFLSGCGQSDIRIDDFSRLNSTRVRKIVANRDEQGLIDALAEARRKGLKVSIAGKRHSQGGHTFYPDALVLDMTAFNKVLWIDPEQKTIRVQSGATWEDVQKAANPYHLSVKVMQAYNIFTVGGTLSVNVHESDLRYGPLVQTVRSFRLLLADGSIVEVSRTQHPDLFSLVIGGYGLFGVILDVELDLTDDVLLEKSVTVMDYHDYPQIFKQSLRDKNVQMEYARASIIPGENFLKEIAMVTYRPCNQALTADACELREEGNRDLRRAIFSLSRHTDWCKSVMWMLQRRYGDVFSTTALTRNNVMRADINILTYSSATDTDVLQEYFVPVDQFVPVLDGMRTIMAENHVNILNVGIRYVPANGETMLTYSPRDCFGIVFYINHQTAPEAIAAVEKWTRQLIDLVLEHQGTYYLPYRSYATSDQLRRSYPRIDEFFRKKKEYDPNEVFMNKFYAKYKLGSD